MTKSIPRLATLVLGLTLISSACSKRHAQVVTRSAVVATPPAETVISEAPPPMPHEVVAASPGPGFYWIPGYWSWQGLWVWVQGAWTIPPSPHAVYVPGHWAHRAHGYVWISGHWR